MANFWDNDPVVSPFDAALHMEGMSGPKADLARSIYAQESSSGKNTQTSNAGAVGGMQIIPSTFASVADDGWDINNPLHNARAGLRYINQLWDTAGGDPRLTAVGYYGGPGAIAKARRGVAVSDPRNPNAPNTLQYGDSVVGRMAKFGDRVAQAMLPSARAETPPAPWESDPIVEDATPWANDPLVEQSEDDKGGYLRQVGSGLLEGVTGALGAPVDLTNAALGLGMQGVNSLFGTDFQPSQEPLGGSRGLRRGLPIAPESKGTGQQMARRIAQSVGGAAIPVAAGARSAGQLAAGFGTAIGGGIGGATAQQLFPNNPSAEIVGELIGGIGTGGTISGLANRYARRAAERAVPPVEQLRQQASDKFNEAHRSGVTASQKQTQGLAHDMRSIAAQEGLISPTGRVSEAYPKAREALRMMDDYAKGSMSVPQMQTVRKVLADAAGSSDAAERRIATLMLKQFDDFTAPLAPPLAQARNLYSRAMRGDQLETLRELAGARAGQFTGSGYENALRTEYRALDRRITRGQEKGWSPEQIKAIRRVARGTGTSNTFRNIGRMAPTGVVSMSLGGGVPFMVGNALGGPAIGSALGAVTMGGGFIARDLATKLGISYAEAAELLARNGGLLQGATNAAVGNSAARGLLGSVLATDTKQ